MKFKHLFTWLLIFIMCFTLISCDNSDDTTLNTQTPAPTATAVPPVGSARPLLYKVSNKNGSVIWLFGSIHAGRESYYRLPDYVMEPFYDSDCLAVEADIIAFESDFSMQTEALKYLIYRDGSTIKNHISDKLYDEAVHIMVMMGSYTPLLDNYCPAFWSTMIDSMQIDEDVAKAELGVDRYLLKHAKDSGKKIVEIESAKSQYKMLAGFSNELQEYLLAQSVASYNSNEDDLELVRLMDIWASGDEQALIEYIETDTGDIPEEERVLYDEYYKAMYTDRNIYMADYAQTALNTRNKVFICVGAAHVVGEGSITQILAQRGYTVELIIE